MDPNINVKDQGGTGSTVNKTNDTIKLKEDIIVVSETNDNGKIHLSDNRILDKEVRVAMIGNVDSGKV
jgi:hypothetical protein